MTESKHKKELEFLKHLNIREERKIKFIETLYRLAHINFNHFLLNDGQ